MSSENIFPVVNNLLERYAKDDVITQMESKIARYVKRSTMLLLAFANDLWLGMLRLPQVYDKYVLDQIFVEGLR